jgi:hypothetical protein
MKEARGLITTNHSQVALFAYVHDMFHSDKHDDCMHHYMSILSVNQSINVDWSSTSGAANKARASHAKPSQTTGNSQT